MQVMLLIFLENIDNAIPVEGKIMQFLIWLHLSIPSKLEVHVSMYRNVCLWFKPPIS